MSTKQFILAVVSLGAAMFASLLPIIEEGNRRLMEISSFIEWLGFLP